MSLPFAFTLPLGALVLLLSCLLDYTTVSIVKLLALCLTDCLGLIFTFENFSGNCLRLNTLLQSQIKQLFGGQMAKSLGGIQP